MLTLNSLALYSNLSSYFFAFLVVLYYFTVTFTCFPFTYILMSIWLWPFYNEYYMSLIRLARHLSMSKLRYSLRLNLNRNQVAKLFAVLREDLSSEILFRNNMIYGPPALYRLLRQYFVLKVFSVEQYPHTNRNMNGLAHCFFTNKRDKTVAIRSLESTPLSQPTIVELLVTKYYEIER